MPDYLLKSKVINSPILEDYKKWSKMEYDFAYTDKQVSLEQLNILREIIAYHEKHSSLELKEASRISHSHLQRVIRLRKRITNMILKGDCIFLTLTFTDTSLHNMSTITRRKRIQEYLTSLNAFDYVANIDFGKRNHREHYHALVQIDKIDYNSYKLGSINGIKVRNNTDDIERLARYVAKLTNHAIKETTKRQALIYCRKRKNITEF